MPVLITSWDTGVPPVCALPAPADHAHGLLTFIDRVCNGKNESQ